jgi:hypothetical protein
VHHYMTCLRAETHRQREYNFVLSQTKNLVYIEVRFWHEDELLGIQKVKNSNLNLVQF